MKYPPFPTEENMVDANVEKKPNIFQRIGGHIQNKIMSGLLELLPVLITVIVIVYIVNLIDNMAHPILTFLAERGLTFPFMEKALSLPGVGIAAGIIFFYTLGLLISLKFGKKAADFIVNLFGKIPVVKGVFGVTTQITSVFTSDFGFSRVVFLEWPREGMIAMGFVTARVQPARESDSSMAIVYIPTIPNPTSGNMALVVEDDLMETDLSVENAMKLIFSGGIVPPDSLSIARLPGAERSEHDFLGRFHTDRQE